MYPIMFHVTFQNTDLISKSTTSRFVLCIIKWEWKLKHWKFWYIIHQLLVFFFFLSSLGWAMLIRTNWIYKTFSFKENAYINYKSIDPHFTSRKAKNDWLWWIECYTVTYNIYILPGWYILIKAYHPYHT